MPTVIDSLIVSLDLDPSKFTKGQKAAAAAALKAKNEQQKAAKEMEAAFNKTADSIDRLARNALKLFAIFTAGRAVKDFVADIAGADAALGRLAQRIGQAPSDISALATAVQRSGGSFDGAAGSFQRFSDSIQELKATGNTSILPFLYRVQAAGGKTINLNKSISQTYQDLADNLKVINDTQGAATANFYGRQLGLDEGTVALLVKGGDAVRNYIEQSRRLGIATKADTDAAQNFQTALRSVMQASEGLGRAIMTTVTPTVVDLLTRLQKWIELNREWIRTEITDRIKLFADYLKSIDWNAIGEGIQRFISGANDAAKAVGGWKTVAELFFGLWAASKMAALFAPILGSIATVRLALLRLGPIGWALLGVGSVGAALAEADPNKAIVSGGKNPTTTLNPGDELPGLGSDLRSLGGAGIRMRGRRAGSHHVGGSASGPTPAVPDTVPMTASERNTLGLIMKYESHGRNTMNYVGKSQGLDPNTATGYTAQGYYQMLNSNWRRIAPQLGIKTSNAMSSSLKDQTRVALHLLRHGGSSNWTNYNPALRRAIAAGEKAAPSQVPAVSPSSTAPATPATPPAASKPSAWNGYPGASDAIAATHTAQAGLVSSRTMNDNRSTTSSEANFNGGIHIHTATTTGDGIASELQDSIRRKSFATAANYGQA